MIKHNQDGAVNGLAISFGLSIVLLIAAISFGAWAYSSRQDYKQHSDAKSAVAVQVAVQKEDTAKDAAFAQQEKDPLTTYNGPQAYGSVVLRYPKTWSGYVDTSGTGASTPVDGYFASGVVPSISDMSSVFALRLQVLNQSYAQTLQAFATAQKEGTLTVSAYALPKLPSVTGVHVAGKLSDGDSSTITMVVLPLRSGTIELSTEGDQYLNDFNTNILPNFSFSP